MSHELDPELLNRLKLVEDPTYEGESLNTMDYLALILVGLILPFALMVWGWI